MSADAFAASIAKGAKEAKLHKPRISDALKVGAIFGVVEATTTLLGWLLGITASDFIVSVDHWIAFLLLGGVGSHMIIESVSTKRKGNTSHNPSFYKLLFVAIGTSIDSMAVGITLAFLDINIWIAAMAIGLATFSMSTIGTMTGHLLGAKAGKLAECIGGIALITIGTSILFEHLQII